MFPLDIHIEGQKVEILPEWREKIEEELARLQKHYGGPIFHARVAIIATGHHRLGAFEVHLVISVPGETITLSHQGDFVHPVLVEAFDALDQRLSEHHAKIQREAKVHEEFGQTGKILRIFLDWDYGFIEAPDGLEVYFHAHALKKGHFETLAPGMKVKFATEAGDQGPQAIWVRVID